MSSPLSDAMKRAESTFLEMISTLKTVPDEAAYCCIIDGYVQREDLNNALEWVIRMLDAGKFYLDMISKRAYQLH